MTINTENLLFVGTAITVVSPYISAIFTQDKYPAWVNELIAVVISIIGGIATFLGGGGHFVATDLPSLWGSIAAIFAASKIYYSKLLPNSPLIRAIEYYTGGKQSGQPEPDEVKS